MWALIMLTSATGRDVGELPGAQGVKDLVVTAVALAAMMAHAAQVRSLVQEFPPAVVLAKKKKKMPRMHLFCCRTPTSVSIC